MSRPAPDALLIARYVAEWPHIVSDPDEPCRAVYLYRVEDEIAGQRPEVHGYEKPGGIGKTEEDGYSRVVRLFSREEMVKLHLVYEPDYTLHHMEPQNFGRDVRFEEWAEAREWLAQQEELDHG